MGVSIGGIRQYHAGCGNPDGIELFIKSASRLFFQIEIQREAILRLTTICQTKNWRKGQDYGYKIISDFLSAEADER